MNLSSALIKQCVLVGDFETWSYLRKEYLPAEYHLLYEAIDSHCENFHSFPSFDDLKLSTRHGPTRDKVYAIESQDDVDVDAGTLLEYLKNDTTFGISSGDKGNAPRHQQRQLSTWYQK